MNVFGKVEDNKRDALKRLNYWDNVEIIVPLLPMELDQEMEAMEDFKKWAPLKETSSLKNLGNYGSRRGIETPTFSIKE